ncbi:MAG: Mur ligase domain-containing protein, partial [Gemmatimonadota bacterium]|nr:Mur ligase domain-containing protein [Gemmatimonadota bacterium]
MSALALVARRRGVAATGCDIDVTETGDLKAAGIEIFDGHDPSHVQNARAVVYTSAASMDHVEIVEAKKMGVPVVRRAEALAQLVAKGTVVAIAGTHGKTTTTAMATAALAQAGKDPTGIVGGRIAQWNGNARLGGDELFVVEADEYDKSFLALEPDIAVINNVEPEHLECYGSEEAMF